MYKRFFTADWHLNHANIIKYTNRPYKDTLEMNEALVANCNKRAKDPTDTVVHVGDLYFAKTKDVKAKLECYIAKINASFVNVHGNHDTCNKVKSLCNFMYTKLGPYHVSVAHRPSVDPDFYIPKLVPIHICGHVHDKWKYLYDADKKVLNVNVGVDVWKYNVVPEATLISFIEKALREVKESQNGEKTCT